MMKRYDGCTARRSTRSTARKFTSTEVSIETSVLVNFLAVDRVDLLAVHPSYRFIITDHVRGEITSYYSEQFERLERAMSASVFGVSPVDSLDPTFVTLVT